MHHVNEAWVLVVFSLLFIVAATFGWVRGGRHKGRLAGAAIVARPALLTANEREFLQRLRRAAPEYDVFPQVSMGALLSVTHAERSREFFETHDLFSRKICDFVLCDKASSAPLLVVELDDRMHDFDKDAARDLMPGFAGLRTLRLWSRNKPSPAVLRQRVLEAIGP